MRGVVRAGWESLVPYWRIVRLLPGVSLPLTLAVAGGVIAGALLPLAATLATGVLVGAVPDAVAGGPDSPAARTATAALAAVGTLFVATRVVGSARATLAAALGRRLDEHLRERVMVALNRPSGVAHLEDPTIRDLIERALDVSGSRWRAGVTVAPLANAAGAWLQSAGVTLLLARFDLALALAWFAVCAVAAQFLRREFLRVTQLAYSQASALRRADYVRHLALSGDPAKEVRLWGMLGWTIERYVQEAMRVLVPTWDARARGNRVHAIASLAIGVVQLAVLVAVGSAAARGETSLRDLTVYVGAILTLGVLHLPRGESLPLAYGTATIPAVLELERLTARAQGRETSDAPAYGTSSPRTTASAPGAGPDAPGATAAPLIEGMPRQGIRLEGVSFRYAPGAPDVLRDLELWIPAGRSLAIVGENGAGKTTLIKLIARLYDPSAGRVTVDGVDLRQIAPQAWQRRVSAVFQDFVRFALPARDNVAFGAPERMDDQVALAEAARKAGALEIIEGLPRGWETVLSRQYAGGADLSGGQWQRLALARALFAVGAGARVLVLDEPTAHLDVRAEAALYARFLELTRGLTTVLISHRFATVRRADRIVVLEGGRVVEDGTHTELLAAGGRYARMFTLQAQRFAGAGALSGYDASAEGAAEGPGGSGRA
ncbi:MAG TPA: ATP-binding cassette domain-containing protein [Chloroflexota bacterium]|nr:ATP-binding cassette domain-containing protein [Chloroflexota bacterium]